MTDKPVSVSDDDSLPGCLLAAARSKLGLTVADVAKCDLLKQGPLCLI